MGNYFSKLFSNSKIKSEFDTLFALCPTEATNIDDMIAFNKQFVILKESYPDFDSSRYQSQFDLVFQPKLLEKVKLIYNSAKQEYTASATTNSSIIEVQKGIDSLNTALTSISNYSQYYTKDSSCDDIITEINKLKDEGNKLIAIITQTNNNMIKAKEIFCNIVCGYGITKDQDIGSIFTDGYNEYIYSILMMFSEFQPILFNTTISEGKKYIHNMLQYYSEAYYNNNDKLFITYKSYLDEFYNSLDIIKNKENFFNIGKKCLKKFPLTHIKGFGYYAQRYFDIDQGVLEVPNTYPAYNIDYEKVEASLVVINKIIEITSSGKNTSYFDVLNQYDIYSDKPWDGVTLIPTTAISPKETKYEIKTIQSTINPYQTFGEVLLIQAEDSTIPQRFTESLNASVAQVQEFIKTFIDKTEVFTLFSNPHLFNSVDYITYQPEKTSSAGPKLVRTIYNEMITKAMNYFVILPFETTTETYSINTFDILHSCAENSLNDFIYKF